MLEEIVTGTEVVVVEDARTDPRTNKEIVHALGNRTIVNVPILLASRRLGALGTGTFGEEGVRPLTGEERKFLAGLGSHVAAVLNRLTVGLERDQAEHALKVFRMLLDQSSDALEVIDPETARFLDCNEQSHLTLGWTRDELLRMAVWDIDPLITPENWGERMDALRRARRATIQGIHRRKDGSTFPVEINAGWVDLDRPYVVSVARDVSERQQLEEQVRQSQKMEAIGKLAGGVAHDFNNLLCVISGYAELCLMRLPESDPSQKMLSEIRSAGEQAARLTRQLLAFSRQQVLAPTVLDLNEVVRDVRTMLRRLIGEDVLLTTMLAPDLCRVQVDAGQINQVIMNLAINARDAMPDGGQLILETFNVDRPLADRETTGETRMQKAVLLSVTDTGWGMTPEVRERIFEPFYTTKGMGRGTGLGLAVVHGIVKQSGGEIEVETAEGEGTTFRIYLPAIT
ncbi:MAG: two-component system sensor histidine kinase NtrB, partial [Actinomycetota bacterium]